MYPVFEACQKGFEIEMKVIVSTYHRMGRLFRHFVYA